MARKPEKAVNVLEFTHRVCWNYFQDVNADILIINFSLLISRKLNSRSDKDGEIIFFFTKSFAIIIIFIFLIQLSDLKIQLVNFLIVTVSHIRYCALISVYKFNKALKKFNLKTDEMWAMKQQTAIQLSWFLLVRRIQY